VGFSCPILVFEYVGGGKKVIPTWLGLGTSVGATFTRFVQLEGITSVSQELGEAESVFLRMNT
jgi:hypothetical protein